VQTRFAPDDLEPAHAANYEPRLSEGSETALDDCRGSTEGKADSRRPVPWGYAVECSLKALILHHTPEPDIPDKLKRITSGAPMHRPEVLLGELRNLSVQLPAEIARRMRRFDWTTNLRYETGRRDTGETVAFLKTVRAIFDWVEGQLP